MMGVDARHRLDGLVRRITFKITPTRIETYIDGELHNVWTPIDPANPDAGWEVEIP